MAVAVIAAAACAPRPSPSADGPDAQEGLEGCWSLAVGEEGALPTWLGRGEVPEALELVAAAGDGGEAPRRAHSWFGGRREAAPFSAWSPVAGTDSIRVERPGAMAGLVLRLAPTDGGLSGVVVRFTDVVEPGESGRRSAPVRAERRDCPG